MQPEERKPSLRGTLQQYAAIEQPRIFSETQRLSDLASYRIRVGVIGELQESLQTAPSQDSEKGRKLQRNMGKYERSGEKTRWNVCCRLDFPAFEVLQEALSLRAQRVFTVRFECHR